jgi:hypothetical protein
MGAALAGTIVVVAWFAAVGVAGGTVLATGLVLAAVVVVVATTPRPIIPSDGHPADTRQP